jgi:phenylpropionate dioxygenase-like ring-hydroxylating dioxygenase large terminal subunit
VGWGLAKEVRLFEDFANVWTPVAYADELGAGAPLGLTIAKTHVVLFRGRDGIPHALLDRCPHRGAALSLGKVVDGCIECPFHGWRFEGNGATVRVPWNPDAKLHNLHADPVPARELAGQIWIYTAPGHSAPEEPSVNEYLVDPGVRVSGQVIEWRAHWTRAMENMLDWAHLPFVHRKTIGRDLAKKIGGRLEILRDEKSWGVSSRISVDGKEQPGMLDYRWPNQMNLHITLRGKKVLMAVACVPVDAHRTRMMLSIARPFLRSQIFDRVFDHMNKRIAKEDQAVVESSSPAEMPAAGLEQSVRTDSLTLRFRKDYFAHLKGTSARRAQPADAGSAS